MKNYGLFDVTFLFIRLYNITNITNIEDRNSPRVSSRAAQGPQELAIDVCGLRSERGPCTDNLHRFYFHSSSGKCLLFMYGGCGGNRNNFISIEQCQQRCGVKEVKILAHRQLHNDVCGLASEAGSCRKRSRRYYFDRTSGQCKLFIYSGCNGNQNNFMSEELCRQRCIKNEVTTQTLQEADVDVCRLASEKGPCPKYIQRYFFDKTKGHCVSFWYGGCEGNLNNFQSEEECQAICGENDDIDDNTNEDNNDGITETCPENEVYDNCGTACPLTCDNYRNPPDICTLQCIIGCRCQEGFVKNAAGQCVKTEQCETSVQTSTTTTAQNVRTSSHKDLGTSTVRAVLATTARTNTAHIARKILNKITYIFLGNGHCELSKLVGPCKNFEHRYHYNKQSGQCEQFNYGGCGGNANNFIHKEYCEFTCVARN